MEFEGEGAFGCVVAECFVFGGPVVDVEVAEDVEVVIGGVVGRGFGGEAGEEHAGVWGGDAEMGF